MPEMIINSPESRREVFDYDISFVNGSTAPFTICPALGDTISFSDKVILIHLAEKPSPLRTGEKLDAEDITVFTPHVLFIQKRRREIVDLDPEKRFEWEQMVKSMTNTIN